MGTMHILGKKGDSTVTWDLADAKATDTVRQTFYALRKQGMLAFVPGPSGGEQIVRPLSGIIFRRRGSF